MRRLVLPAILLTTAVAAQDMPNPKGHSGDVLFCPPDCPPKGHVSDVLLCPAPEPGYACGAHCVVEIKDSNHGARQLLYDAVKRCNTTVLLGPDVVLDFSDDLGLRPLLFGPYVTLTSVNDFKRATSEARTPRTPGPILKYGPPDRQKGGATTFLGIGCDNTENKPPSDHIRISGFRLYGPTTDFQYDSDVGIRDRSCFDVEISNMEIAGWGEAGIAVEDKPEGLANRINDFSQVRIHDNYIHHNQHPTKNGHAGGYGVNVTEWGARAHIYRNVFDWNRHAIAADGNSGGYVAEENLVLKGGGYHHGGLVFNEFTHLFDVHGTGGNGFGGQAGEEVHIVRNSFQYTNKNAIHIRGKPRDFAYIAENIFPHDNLVGDELDTGGAAIRLHLRGIPGVFTFGLENIRLPFPPEPNQNILKTDTYGEYYSQCDFDGDGVDDLFLATGATWWFSSSGKFPWSFLNTSSKRKKDLRFGYFDDDDRCDVLTETGGDGRWLISSGGTGQWKPLERLQGGIEKGFKAPLDQVVFGRFDPNDLTHSQRTTHAFWRKPSGEWYVTPLSNPDGWEHVGGSSKPLSALRFGDFTGDGVTDVLAVDGGHWAISESARKNWQQISSLGDPVAGLYIANMDPDDNIDDILRFQYSKSAGDVTLTWWRSKNGRAHEWERFKQYLFLNELEGGTSLHAFKLHFGFVGRFSPCQHVVEIGVPTIGTCGSGGTLIVDRDRYGHFYIPGGAGVVPSEYMSSFPY